MRACQMPLALAQWNPRTSHTLLIDLRQTEDELFAGIKKDTRRQIRAALKDNMVCEIMPDSTPIERMCSYYDRFAARAGLKPANVSKLLAMKRSGSLFSTTVRARDSEDILAWHIFLRAESVAELMYSSTALADEDSDPEERKRIGKAHRLLVWHDLLYCKSLGLPTFDFGGWYTGQTDLKLLNVNRFKALFGGNIVEQFEGEKAVTFRGGCALAGSKLVARLTESVRGPQRYAASGGASASVADMSRSESEHTYETE